MPVTYPDLDISIKNTFLHFDFGAQEPSALRAKKRSSSWSGHTRSTARDACVHRDASMALTGGCSDEAEREAPSVSECDAALTHNSLASLFTSPQNSFSPMPFLHRPGVLHGSIVNQEEEICSECGQLHRVRARPSKLVREKVKREILVACEIQDESSRMWHLQRIVERHGAYACKLRAGQHV
eukprot:TRINITY_DN5087_c0_g1_i4.p1 TRINITY_DN5087_c0_g1~~TRINITY_DN5087_c0_g1_i4.p1  ORF type:complete len:183 (-),score=25.84 TRINITY_DN5087_c0_g1_i4:157-705(-)